MVVEAVCPPVRSLGVLTPEILPSPGHVVITVVHQTGSRLGSGDDGTRTRDFLLAN
jgi:hypothetical protein